MKIILLSEYLAWIFPQDAKIQLNIHQIYKLRNHIITCIIINVEYILLIKAIIEIVFKLTRPASKM